MIDPETARQAVQAWNIQSTDSIQIALNPIHLIDAGDALAVLVPQLLDQLAVTRQASQDLGPILAALMAERDALGERCRQLEAALTEMSAPDFPEYVRAKARAALGDPKETDE